MAYDIERYLNIRSAHSASFGPAGDRVSFLMNTTGTPQVWTLSDAGTWPAQRTYYEERVTFATWSPERDELIFGKDEGGNERTQFFRLSGNGADIVSLTGRPDAKHRWGGWSHDGNRFAFTSNRRDEAVFDVYVQGRNETGETAERVREGDGWLTVGGWSPDDDRLIVTEAHSSFDQDVYVLDLRTGAMTHLTPHEGRIRYQSVEWGPDGEYLYLVTDDGADTMYLARMDTRSGDTVPVVEGGRWNVNGVALDQDSGRLVYTRNVEGYTEVTVARLANGGKQVEEFPSPDLPDGVAGGVSFAPAADRFALTATARDHTTNVYVVTIESGSVERWTRASTAGIPRESFRSPTLVRYESFDGLSVPAFFTLPEPAPTGATPVVVDIHGGPESQRRPSFSPVTQYLVHRGYGVFEPNVRGSAGYGKEYTHLDDRRNRMDSVADIKAAVEWLHDHPAVDPDRIACKGGSYGGFMVLACLTEYPDLWAAGVDIVGIANFVTFLENTGDWRRELREAEYGSLTEDRAFLAEISPIHNTDAISAPLFVLHGENDPRVPVGEARQIVEEARAQDVPVRALLFDDEGHGITKLANRIRAYAAITEFLDEHVGGH